MLILTRRVGESILIDGMVDGAKIKITLLGFKGAQARIGVDAPRNVTIDREEVHERKLAEKAP